MVADDAHGRQSCQTTILWDVERYSVCLFMMLVRRVIPRRRNRLTSIEYVNRLRLLDYNTWMEVLRQQNNVQTHIYQFPRRPYPWYNVRNQTYTQVLK